MSESVGDLLAQSRQAHMAAKHQSGRRSQSDPVAYRANLQAALQFRQQAFALDPHRLDPAWQGEQPLTPQHIDTHDALVEFFQQQLSDE